MYVALLIAAPGRLDPTLPEALRAAWGGGAVRWLSEGEAAEFPVAVPPGHREDVWRDLQGRGVDLAIVPEAGRAKRLLLADMDSTMIAQECIDEIAAEAGVGAEVAAITARAMDGALDFEAALDARVALLAGLEEAVLDRVFTDRITFAPGGATLVATMRARGAHTALVSGGFTFFTDRVGAALGFDEARANVLEARDGRLTGTVARPILGADAKVEALAEIGARLGIGPDAALAVGDGANDLGMLARAGMGVALHAKPVVQAACDLRVNHGDLTALLYLQGYARDTFVAA
ncbi:MAG: phosphoserine phosphatase SerB [Shimia sp.]